MCDVVRRPRVGANSLEDNFSQQAAKNLCRQLGPALQEGLKLGNPLDDPRFGRNLKSRTIGVAQCLSLGLKVRHTRLGLRDRAGDGRTVRDLAARDELDQVGETLASCHELGLLAVRHAGDFA